MKKIIDVTARLFDELKPPSVDEIWSLEDTLLKILDTQARRKSVD